MDDFEVYIAQDGQTYRYLINNANFESFIKVVKVCLLYTSALIRTVFGLIEAVTPHCIK